MIQPAKLYIVPTPVGNLEDITLRALRILKEVDVIVAEDTRTSSTLLKHYNINTRLLAHHQHNEHHSVQGIIPLLQQNKSVAIISDAGTPGISDPGFLLIRECLKHSIDVECLPGATALIPALVSSGLPCDRFVFEGFLPHKKGRHTALTILKEETRTIVFYESPHRLLKTLSQCLEYLGNRQAAVCRELSKLHEEIKRGTLEELITYYTAKPVKGEIVLIIKGKD